MPTRVVKETGSANDKTGTRTTMVEGGWRQRDRMTDATIRGKEAKG